MTTGFVTPVVNATEGLFEEVLMAVPRISACGDGSLDRSHAVSPTRPVIETTNMKLRTALNYIRTQRATTRFTSRRLTMANGDSSHEHFSGAARRAVQQFREGAGDVLLRFFGHWPAGDVTAHGRYHRF